MNQNKQSNVYETNWLENEIALDSSESDSEYPIGTNEDEINELVDQSINSIIDKNISYYAINRVLQFFYLGNHLRLKGINNLDFLSQLNLMIYSLNEFIFNENYDNLSVIQRFIELLNIFKKQEIIIPEHDISDYEKNIKFLKCRAEAILNAQTTFHKQRLRYKEEIKVIKRIQGIMTDSLDDIVVKEVDY